MISGGPQGTRERVKSLLPVIAVFAVIGGIYVLDPSRGADISVVTLDYLQEMAVIMPAVVLLMGLFQVWIPKSYVERFLGTQAGPWGFVIALLLGSAPTGPLYVAFPLAAALLQKGARTATVVTFLGAWSAAKLPQIMVEIKFLGLDFAALRFVLTAVLAVAMGLLLELLVPAGRSTPSAKLQ